MLHRASLLPSLDRGWITATLCITACHCQTTIFKGYRECRMLPQELFAMLHDANTTQPTFKDLHWLPVHGRVDYKIAVLCYKAVKLQQPSYLTCLLSSYRQSRVLRSSMSDLLSTQSSLANTAARRFSCCVPTVWNSLPSFVRTIDSFTSFRSQLKTYMFAHIYSRSPVRASDTLILVFRAL